MLVILGMLLVPHLSQIFHYILHIFLIITKTNFCVFDGLADRENTIKIVEFINKDEFTRKSMLYYTSGVKEPSGVCFNNTKGKRFLCYIKNENRIDNGRNKLVQTIYLLGKIPVDLVKSNFDVEDNGSNDNEKKFIKVWDKSNDYRDSYIYKMSIPFNYKPYKVQEEIMDNIISLYKTSDNNIVRALVYGKPGKGKSFIGKLLAKKLNGELATYINLTTPGCGFRSLYKSASPKLESPLIIQLDEIDVTIRKVNNLGVNDSHKWIETACYDKSSYNNFWSEFVIRYPFVIWVLTMNSTPFEINKLDECYIRNNRLDIISKFE